MPAYYHNHPAYQPTITQSPCIPPVLSHTHPACQLTITITLHTNLLSHNLPAYQLYYHTVTLYTNCTITQSPHIATVLSHNHPVYHPYYHTIALHTTCAITHSPCMPAYYHNHPAYQLTITQSPCIPTVLSHNHPVCQLTITQSPCIPTYYHTITLYTNLQSHNRPV